MAAQYHPQGPQPLPVECDGVAQPLRTLRRGVQGTPWQGKSLDVPVARPRTVAITAVAVLPDLVTAVTS